MNHCISIEIQKFYKALNNFHPFSSYVMKDYVHVYYLHVAN